MNIISTINIILPETILFIGSLFLILLGSLRAANKSLNYNNCTIFILFLVLTALIFGDSNGSVFNNSFVNNSFTKFMKIFIVVLAIIILYVSNKFLINNHLNFFEYPILLTLSLIGMLAMVSANDLIVMYIAIELQSLSLYVLVALKRDSTKSSEAALKYFILGSIASAIILYGSSMVYSVTGVTNYGLIKAFNLSDTTLTVFSFGLVLILSGIAFKLSAAPFHMWTPDVYEGSPTSVTTILITLPKLAAIAVLIKLLYEPFQAQIVIWQQILSIIAITSMIIGSISALKQENFKRLLAFSTISNMGFIILGILTGTNSGLASAILYMLLYTVGSLGIFTFLMMLRREEKQLVNISSVAGLSKSQPSISLCLAILLLSLAGIPPFAGFFAKLYIFIAAVENGFLFLAIFAVIFSVVSAYYYLKIIKVMYFDEEDEVIKPNYDKRQYLLIILSASAMLVFIFFAENIISFIQNMRII